MTSSLQLTRAEPKPGRRERRRTETRERIFRAAMQLFAQHGFFSTTVEDITEAADVGKGTFFNYFPSKEHVLTVLRSEEHTSELQSLRHLVCRLLLEKTNKCQAPDPLG